MTEFVIIGLILAALVAILVIAARQTRANLERRVEVWRRFAREHDYRLVEPTGPWYRRRCWSVEGTLESVPFKLDTYTVNSGKHQVTYTRLRSGIPRDVPKITAGPRSFLTGIGETFGWKTVRTGDPEFDRKMAARASSSDAALRVFDDDVRARSLEIGRRSLCIRCKGEEAKVWWRGAEFDPQVLESGTRLVAALSRSCARA